MQPIENKVLSRIFDNRGAPSPGLSLGTPSGKIMSGVTVMSRRFLTPYLAPKKWAFFEPIPRLSSQLRIPQYHQQFRRKASSRLFQNLAGTPVPASSFSAISHVIGAIPLTIWLTVFSSRPVIAHRSAWESPFSSRVSLRVSPGATM